MQDETKALVERLKVDELDLERAGWIVSAFRISQAAHIIEAQAAQISTLGKALAEANAALELAGDERDAFRAQLAEAHTLMLELIQHQGNGVWWANTIREHLAKAHISAGDTDMIDLAPGQGVG